MFKYNFLLKKIIDNYTFFQKRHFYVVLKKYSIQAR